jgi:DNA-binding HxlR family transcriptional regulator
VENRRNYKQFCGLARALDRVGERWTLLVVRNLLLGPRRYSDLLEELPGLTTNLLAARLREMEKLGLVHKRAALSPVRANVYELTPMGRALEPALMELARWGGRFMDRPNRADTLNVGWALLSLKRRYRGGLTLVVELGIDERRFELAFTPRHLAVTEGAATRPDLSVAGSLADVRAWLFGGADARALAQVGKLRVEGAETAWEALLAAFSPREPSAEEIATRLASREILEPIDPEGSFFS